MARKHSQSWMLTFHAIVSDPMRKDKFFKMIGYLSKLLSALMRRKSVAALSERFQRLSSAISQYRVMSRLTDDVPMLLYSLSYGLGDKTGRESPAVRLMNVFKNLCDQFYYPLEHVAWAADLGLLRLNSVPLWYFGDMLWLTSLSIGLCLSFIKWQAMARERKQLARRMRASAPAANVAAAATVVCEEEELRSAETERYVVSRRVAALQAEQRTLSLRVLKDLCDAACAVHWLPAGWLWAEALPEEAVGALGAASGALGLALLWPQPKSGGNDDDA